jgi:hypothetical protein
MKYYLGNQIEEKEMGGACSTYGRSKIRTLYVKKLKEREHFGDRYILFIYLFIVCLTMLPVTHTVLYKITGSQ